MKLNSEFCQGMTPLVLEKTMELVVTTVALFLLNNCDLFLLKTIIVFLFLLPITVLGPLDSTLYKVEQKQYCLNYGVWTL